MGNYSESYSFKTQAKSVLQQKINCGNQDVFETINNTKPLFTASAGNIFKIGKFDLMVTEVTGANGNYSGQGNIFVPFMYATVKVAFNNLQVNENSQVFGGEAKTLNTGLSLLSAAELSAMAFEDGKGMVKDI